MMTNSVIAYSRLPTVSEATAITDPVLLETFLFLNGTSAQLGYRVLQNEVFLNICLVCSTTS